MCAHCACCLFSSPMLFALVTAFVLGGTIFRFVCTHFSCIRYGPLFLEIFFLHRHCPSMCFTLRISLQTLMLHSASLVCRVKCDACDKYRQLQSLIATCTIVMCKCVLRASFFLGIDFCRLYEKKTQLE